jgi:hypothetical protein
LISLAIPPAILPNSLLLPDPAFGVLRPFSFGIRGCLASDLPFPPAEDEEAGRDERDLIDASVEWNSLVRSLGAILTGSRLLFAYQLAVCRAKTGIR